MPDFPNMWTVTERVYCEAGNPIRDIYKSRFDKNGNVVVEKKGTEDLWAKIQSNADSVDINVLIAKYQSGDVNALNRRQAMFGIDNTVVPDNYFELHNKISDLKDVFKGLPSDVKANFDNDPEKFVNATRNDPEFIAKLSGKDYKKDVQIIGQPENGVDVGLEKPVEVEHE